MQDAIGLDLPVIGQAEDLEAARIDYGQQRLGGAVAQVIHRHVDRQHLATHQSGDAGPAEEAEDDGHQERGVESIEDRLLLEHHLE